MPETVEEYVHRAGRTARVDASGIVSTIATWQELRMVAEIEAAIGQQLPRCSVAGIPAWVEASKSAKPRERRRV